MTTVHAQILGDQAIVPRNELDALIDLARRSAEVQLETDDLPNAGLLWLAEQGGAFKWLADEEDLYSVQDLKVRYR
jgi:hypothetical protein